LADGVRGRGEVVGGGQHTHGVAEILEGPGQARGIDLDAGDGAGQERVRGQEDAQGRMLAQGGASYG
jgi:hypothetical protein